jgi:hypothetical protein
MDRHYYDLVLTEDIDREFALFTCKDWTDLKVQSACPQGRAQDRIHSDEDADSDLGSSGNENTASLRKQIFCHGRTRSDADMTGLARCERSHVAQRRIHGRPHLARIAEQNFSDRRQSDPPTHPRKQRRADRGFQSLTAFRECGLRSAQPIRRAAKMPCLGDHFEIGEVAPWNAPSALLPATMVPSRHRPPHSI